MISNNHTRWADVVTSTDHPKSVHNRCVIEAFGGVLWKFCCRFAFLNYLLVLL